MQKYFGSLAFWPSVNVAALFSGGKDSAYSIYLAQQRGWAVKTLVTMLPKRGDSYMFHVPNAGLAPLLAEAMGLLCKTISTSGKKEAELEDLKRALANLNVDGVVTGAIASDYQASRIDRICFDLGLVTHNLLWRRSQRDALEDIISAGFNVIIVGVYAEGLGRDWLGRRLNTSSLEDLARISKKHGINISGEGGEFETLVLDGPNFRKRVEILESRINWRGASGEIIVENARLVGK